MERAGSLRMRRIIIPYYPLLVDRARELRNHSTRTEVKLWKYLKRRLMRGLDFHRQKPLLRYIVDFYCCEAMLAIEVDGSWHRDRAEYDRIRQQALEAIGVRFLRFTTREIENDIEGVVRRIEEWIDAHPERPGLIEPEALNQPQNTRPVRTRGNRKATPPPTDD